MAHFHPSLPPRRALTAGDHAELAVLRLLEDGLSDAYTLFHSVDWTDAVGADPHADARHGEVDIVIVNQAGDVMQLARTLRDVQERIAIRGAIKRSCRFGMPH